MRINLEQAKRSLDAMRAMRARAIEDKDPHLAVHYTRRVKEMEARILRVEIQTTPYNE